MRDVASATKPKQLCAKHSWASPLPVIEQYTRNVRFCIICNYVNKIIPAIQSRCTKFRFNPLELDQVEGRLQVVIDNEGCNLTQNGRAALIKLSRGDMRRALNILQVSEAVLLKSPGVQHCPTLMTLRLFCSLPGVSRCL